MNEYTLIWLFGGAFGAIAALGGWMVALKIQMATLQTTLNIMANMMGKKAAWFLHSPHTPEFDALVDKFRADALTVKETESFKTMLHKIESTEEAATGDRLAAASVLLYIEPIDSAKLKSFNDMKAPIKLV
jgi:hypothetical protein